MSDSSAQISKPYTVWLDYSTEGWHPTDCDSVAECFEYMQSVGHSGKYRITCPVVVEFIAHCGCDAE